MTARQVGTNLRPGGNLLPLLGVAGRCSLGSFAVFDGKGCHPGRLGRPPTNLGSTSWVRVGS